MPTPDLQALIDLSVDEAGLHAACRVVAANAGKDFDQLGLFTQETIRGTQRQCIEAYLRSNHSTLTAPTLPGAGGGDDHVAIGWIRPGQDFTEASSYDDVSSMMDRGWQPVALIPPSAAFSLPPQQGG